VTLVKRGYDIFGSLSQDENHIGSNDDNHPRCYLPKVKKASGGCGIFSRKKQSYRHQENKKWYKKNEQAKQLFH